MYSALVVYTLRIIFNVGTALLRSEDTNDKSKEPNTLLYYIYVEGKGAISARVILLIITKKSLERTFGPFAYYNLILTLHRKRSSGSWR